MPTDRMTARERIQRLLDQGHLDDPDAFAEPVPPPFERAEPAGWLWDGTPHPGSLFGLRDPRAYTNLADGELAAWLHEPVAVALGSDHTPHTHFSDQQVKYVRHSVDVTMKGGTTSGVVYPLAVCEIARRFRLRNVGGASAGAIAAACAAAAEVGRAGEMAPDTRGTLGPAATDQPPPTDGRVRAGFVGVADLAAWYTQSDTDPGAPDEFRIGQLFRPTPIARPVFRMIIAAMRGRYAQIPVLLTAAMGVAARLFTALALLLAPAAAMDWAADPQQSDRGYLVAAGWLLAMSLTIISAIVLGFIAFQRVMQRDPVPTDLAEPVETPGPRPRRPIWLAVTALVLGVVLAVLLTVVFDHWAAVGWARMVLVWVGLVLVVVGIQVAAVLKIVFAARRHRFGLLSGSDPADATSSRWDRFWDRFAGAPRPTVTTNLMDWLHAALSDLAGLSEASGEPKVLRFGHLWFGAGYAPGSMDQDQLLQAASASRHRLVNLELMTSELVHGVSMRFPMRPDAVVDDRGQPLLLIRHSDLNGGLGPVLPQPVIDALCAGPAITARDVTTGDTITDLHQLPMPWDLPVLFAVRLSMALPGLFQAVRMYRPEQPRAVRDNFGARLVAGDQAPAYPPTNGTTWVQEMWMSDGGITSNFPIHFFDNPLPLWPTLGINLGRHPRGSAHQDVWLPDDGESRTSLPAPLGRHMLSFLAAIFNTAMSWRDTAQTFMPAFRGRIAWVRQRSDEGGSNLFMDADTISALALRGAMAGARLSKRYADEGHWRRHQWLRMRVALGNLNALQSQLAMALSDPIYCDIADEGWSRIAAIQQLMAGSADPAPPVPDGTGEDPLDWYKPLPGFWDDAGPLFENLRTSPGADPDSDLNRKVPLPAPQLRQVPPT